jgi:hypothetical protein
VASKPCKLKKKYWLCRCDCGVVKDVNSENLRNGKSTNCGCKRTRDLTGRRFGRLVAVRKTGLRAFGAARMKRAVWECRCDCGKIIKTPSSYLLNGTRRSCGCLWADVTGKNNYNYKDGRSKMSEYKIYYGAKHRCLDKNDPDYGGRGIKFLYSRFEEFLADVGPRPSSEHSLDRKEVNGNYEPGNCRWATAEEQHANRRVRRLEQFNDQELLAECQRRRLSAIVV